MGGDTTRHLRCLHKAFKTSFLTLNVSKLLGYLVLIFFIAMVHRNRNKVQTSKESLKLIWISPDPTLDDENEILSEFTNICQRLRDGCAFYCGSDRSIKHIEKLNYSWMTAEAANLEDLFSETRFYKLVQHHLFYKILFEDRFFPVLKLVSMIAISLKSKNSLVLDFEKVATQDIAAISKFLDVPSKELQIISSSSINSVELHSAFGLSTSPISYQELTKLEEYVAEHIPNIGIEPNLLPLKYENLSKVLRFEIVSPFEGRPITQLTRKKGYGIFSYDQRSRTADASNSGDELQSLVGLQFVPNLNHFFERDTLPNYDLNATLFGNAWYGALNMMWPPPGSLDMILFSMYIGPEVFSKFEKEIAYLRQRSPVGARDLETLEWLKLHNVPAFFSGCATMLLRNPFSSSQKNGNDKSIGLVIVDVDPKYLRRLVPNRLLRHAIFIEQNVPEKFKANRKSRYFYAYNNFLTYSKARLVITSRLHCAMPASSAGATVIFVQTKILPGGGGHRLQGLTDFFYTVPYTDLKSFRKSFDWENIPPNPGLGKRKRLIANFWDIISKRNDLRDSAKIFGTVPFIESTNFPKEQPAVYHFIGTRRNLGSIGMRSIESVFYHDASSIVYLFCAEEYKESLQNEVSVLSDVGYKISVVPFSICELIEKYKRISGFNTDRKEDFDSLVNNCSELDIWPSKTLVSRLLVLFLEGGISVDLNTILLKPPKDVHDSIALSENLEINTAVLSFSRHSEFVEHLLWNAIKLHLFRQSDLDKNSEFQSLYINEIEALKKFGIRPINYDLFYKIDKMIFSNACARITGDHGNKNYISGLIPRKSYAARVLSWEYSNICEELSNSICQEVLNKHCILCNRNPCTIKP